MTKREQQRLIKETFFNKVTELYPDMEIQGIESGRYLLNSKLLGEFELDPYGDIYSVIVQPGFNMPKAYVEAYKKGIVNESLLQGIYDKAKGSVLAN
jgi:hypothetical protein